MQINKEKVKEAIEVMQENLGVTNVRDIFASYHFQTKDFKFQGFGNVVTKFYPELYKNNLPKFLQDLEKSISMALNSIHKMEFEVKVLYFK